jgi:hypothetical protein
MIYALDTIRRLWTDAPVAFGVALPREAVVSTVPAGPVRLALACVISSELGIRLTGHAVGIFWSVTLGTSRRTGAGVVVGVATRAVPAVITLTDPVLVLCGVCHALNTAVSPNTITRFAYWLAVPDPV